MNTKRFRAATMREALEQVKTELGDDALVLDTKRVRAGGILGVGARELVEVRVAVDKASDKETALVQTHEPRRTSSNSSILNLTDDAPATPARHTAPEQSAAATASAATAAPAFTALAARAYAADNNRPTIAANAPQLTEHSSRNFHNESASLISTRHEEASARVIESVEIAETAPRLVHRRNAATALAASNSSSANSSTANAAAPTFASSTTSNTPTAKNDAAATSRSPLAGELERLRAELREVKFSLNAFNARPLAAAHNATAPALDFDQDAEIYDSPYYETYLLLTAAGLSPELARRATRALLSSADAQLNHSGDQPADVDRINQLTRRALAGLFAAQLRFADDSTITPSSSADIAKHVSAFAFIGPTGVGKTTTIAKLAARYALRERRRVELVTLDTYRIAAVEQLKTYAEIIGANCHIARSVVELDAFTQRFSQDSIVLIDTTGRNPHDLSDQMELADYLRTSANLRKCLVLPATTQPVDAIAAVKKFALYGADRLVITKLDETVRPGLVVETAMSANLPLAHLCAGQRVPEDLERATAESFAARVVRPELIHIA